LAFLCCCRGAPTNPVAAAEAAWWPSKCRLLCTVVVILLGSTSFEDYRLLPHCNTGPRSPLAAALSSAAGLLPPVGAVRAVCLGIAAVAQTDKHVCQPARAIPSKPAGNAAPFPHLRGVVGKVAGDVPGKACPSHILPGLAAAEEAVEVCIRQHLLMARQTRRVQPGGTEATDNPRIFTATAITKRCLLEPADLHAEMRAANGLDGTVRLLASALWTGTSGCLHWTGTSLLLPSALLGTVQPDAPRNGTRSAAAASRLSLGQSHECRMHAVCCSALISLPNCP
jgi:hypothetical protein